MKEKEKRPLISVLICAFNAELFISKTIESAIIQTYQNIEILILDNNSQDQTVEIIKSYVTSDARIRLFVNQTNLGAYAGLNYLLDHSKGTYAAILDHDDIWHPEKLVLQISVLEEHSQYIACGGLPLAYYEATNKFKILKYKNVSHVAPHPTLVFRNDGFRYDTTIKYKTDYYFMKYVLSKNIESIFNVQKPLYIHRLRMDGGNLNKKWAKIGNVLTYYQKTRELNKLFFGVIRCLLPMSKIENLLSQLTAKDKYHFLNDAFVKIYFDKNLI